MIASPLLRHRNEILAGALAVLAVALIAGAAIAVMDRVSTAWAPACHRLLPRLPRLPQTTPWRIAACAGGHPLR